MISSIETNISAPNLVLSILVAIIAAILLIATYPVSGGDINPVITFSAALVGIISFSRVAVYIFMQCVGGVLGALALKAVINSCLEETFSLGGCTLTVVSPDPQGPITVGIGTGQALWLEIICTFISLLASIWMAFEHRQAHSMGKVMVLSIVGIVVGILVFISTSVTAVKGYAGPGMNQLDASAQHLFVGATSGPATGFFGSGLLFLASLSTCTSSSFPVNISMWRAASMISSTM
ncbi:putative major intrinsic protein [Rosa chinensis]|uniref:Putative major intrinsic protein n=1 Tax=Rosa chinensis TaxID=74649 RepID=A0A2P6PJB8_ROSCH|nr:putative major intrinsic protein [Rosa chinensis]